MGQRYAPFSECFGVCFWWSPYETEPGFNIDGHSHKVCCKCGANFHYSLQTMSIVRHHKMFPAFRKLRARDLQKRRQIRQRSNRA